MVIHLTPPTPHPPSAARDCFLPFCSFTGQRDHSKGHQSPTTGLLLKDGLPKVTTINISNPIDASAMSACVVDMEEGRPPESTIKSVYVALLLGGTQTGLSVVHVDSRWTERRLFACALTVFGLKFLRLFAPVVSLFPFVSRCNVMYKNPLLHVTSAPDA